MRPVESELENVLAQLFDRFPALLTNVETFPWSVQPCELLRGRTFARRVH